MGDFRMGLTRLILVVMAVLVILMALRLFLNRR